MVKADTWDNERFFQCPDVLALTVRLYTKFLYGYKIKEEREPRDDSGDEAHETAYKFCY